MLLYCHSSTFHDTDCLQSPVPARCRCSTPDACCRLDTCCLLIGRPLGSKSTATCTRSWLRRMKLWVREGAICILTCGHTHTHKHTLTFPVIATPLSLHPPPPHTLGQSEIRTCPPLCRLATAAVAVFEESAFVLPQKDVRQRISPACTYACTRIPKYFDSSCHIVSTQHWREKRNVV